MNRLAQEAAYFAARDDGAESEREKYAEERQQAVQALRDCVTLIEDMSRFVGKMSLNNYQLFNTAVSDANRAIAALTR